jgi:hypothetical protein
LGFSLHITRPLVAFVLTLSALLTPFRISQAAQIEVCFAPTLPGACDPTESIVSAIIHAHKQVLVQAYEFTSAAIAKSVVDEVEAVFKRTTQIAMQLHLRLHPIDLDLGSEAGAEPAREAWS